jgi:putative nucleotidyltransferase with HDIG domain
MGEKHILVADADAKTLEEFRQALGQQWKITGVGTGAAALEELKKQAYDGLVASLYLPDLEPAQLLNRVRSKYPSLVRFVVAAEKDRDRVVKEVLGAHQFLIRPFDADGLRTTVERALAFDRWVDSDKLRKLVSRMRTLPTVPAVYLELLAALRSADSTTEEVGALIAKDMAIMTKLLQVINSAYFGLPRTVTSPEEAVGLLGFETVKSMVMAIKLLNQYDRIKTGDFSIERLWQHSTAVAHNARRLVLLQTGQRPLAEEAYTAGLLHDVGKAVLAGNFAEQYQGAESLAHKEQIPMCEVEKQIFGASHGELGAYLLGLWGLPMDVLEAAALHHHPARASNKAFTPLTAVHIANVLQYHAAREVSGEVPPKIDMEYLAEIGMVECLPAWCEEILGPEAAGGYLASEAPKPSVSLPGPTLSSAPPPPSTIEPHHEAVCEASRPALTSKEGQEEAPAVESSGLQVMAENHDLAQGEGVGGSESRETSLAWEGDSEGDDESRTESTSTTLEPSMPPGLVEPELVTFRTEPVAPRTRRLVVTSLAALILLAAWFFFGRHSGQTQPPLDVNAQQIKPASLADSKELAVTPPAPSHETTSEVSTQGSRETNSALPVAAFPASAAGVDSVSPGPVSPTTGDTSGQPTVTRAPVFPELKLQGILFSPQRPAAIVNGVLVHANDRLLGVRVVEIRSASITIEYQNQRKKLSLD